MGFLTAQAVMAQALPRQTLGAIALLCLALIAPDSGRAQGALPQTQINTLPRGGARQRTLNDKLGDALTPADFLTAGQTTAQLLKGIIDAAPAINAAMAAGSVYLPCGTYLLNGPLLPPTSITASISLVGAAQQCVTLRVNYAPANLFMSTSQNGVELRNFTVYGAVPQAAGTLFRFNGGYGATIQNVSFNGKRFNDILLSGTNTFKILNSDFRPGATGSCITATGYNPSVGAPAHLQTLDLFVVASGIVGCRYGAVLTDASGVVFSDVEMTSNINGAIVVAPDSATTPPQNVNALRLRNVFADTTHNGPGVQIIGTGAVTETEIDTLWGAGSGNDGVSAPHFTGPSAGLLVANPAVDGMQINGFYGHLNGGPGIDVQGGKHIKIVSPLVCMNGNYAKNTYPGINITAAVDWISISDPTSGKCGYMSEVAGLANQQNWGMIINNNASQHITVLGGQYDGNLSGSWRLHSKTADPNLLTAGTPP